MLPRQLELLCCRSPDAWGCALAADRRPYHHIDDFGRFSVGRLADPERSEEIAPDPSGVATPRPHALCRCFEILRSSLCFDRGVDEPRAQGRIATLRFHYDETKAAVGHHLPIHLIELKLSRPGVDHSGIRELGLHVAAGAKLANEVALHDDFLSGSVPGCRIGRCTVPR